MTIFTITSSTSNLMLLSFLIDTIFVSYIFWKIAIMASIYVMALSIELFIYGQTYKDLRANMAKSIRRISRRRALHKVAIGQLCKLRRFINVQNEVTRYVEVADKQWSAVYYVLLLAMAPSNIYLVVFYYFTQLATTEKVMLLTVLLVQLIAMLTLFVLSQLTLMLQSTAKYIVPVQQLFTNQAMFQLKLHYMILFEKLTSKRKIGYSLGPLGVINRQAMLQVREEVITVIAFNNFNSFFLFSIISLSAFTLPTFSMLFSSFKSIL